MDAFSDGQVGSKLWLCEELERVLSSSRTPWNIAIYGGWYGMAAFLLFSRGRLPIASIRSFDIDPEATMLADLVNKNWEIQSWKFKAFTEDCNRLDLADDAYARQYGPRPSLIINTACEHFPSSEWWEKIPSGTYVVLQSTDQQHDDEVSLLGGLDEMKAAYRPMERILFEGTREFRYPDRSFRRFMLIGTKA